MSPPSTAHPNQMRVFYEERNEQGDIVLRQLIGYPTIHPDGSVTVTRPGNTTVVLRQYHKIEEFIESKPSNGGP